LLCPDAFCFALRAVVKWAVPLVTFVVWSAWPAIPPAKKSALTFGIISDPTAEAEPAQDAGDRA
jgi:hypothetical protein